MLRYFLLSVAFSNAALAAYAFDPLQHLAGITPYFEPSDQPLDPSPPQGCNVTRAAYLVRHAAIYANDFDYEEYIEPFVLKLANTSVDWAKAGVLSFLATWKSPITDAEQEQLTKVGQLEAFTLGVDIGQRYPEFKSPNKIWTSTAERTEKSARSFIEGSVEDSNKTQLISVSEGEKEGADSLTPYESCPAYSSSAGSKQAEVFQKIYTSPIIERFHALASTFNFTPDDIVGMQELCGYETVIRGSSPFCSLSVFTPNEWLGFEYTNDIQYHYNTGYGNPISGVIGYPWLNATAGLLASGNINGSDSQQIYVSFTHRELPPTVLVAMGLFNNSAFSGGNDINATMPTDTPNYRRAWKSSHIIPFLTNIAIERMACDSYGFDVGGYYRVLVNQSPQLLPGCSDGPGESCSTDGFKKFVSDRGALFGGFGEKCGTDYGNSTDVLWIYGS
ncbi:putative histidine acid phosphatase [Glonium stellatum]|uniref:Putative histidine acid phosphatase n=1 Tax=Glonium stellatum TaxID=574774 RepID=A0A8E2JYL7_9PEZI|nr:putative histidine acid phosphatase [Glonium stellatum]